MRCGFEIRPGVHCHVRIVPPMVRCRHHTRADMAYVKAKQRANNLLMLQRDETVAAKARFAATAFEHGLSNPRTVAALAAWRAARAAEGGPDYPASFIEGKKEGKA